MRASLEVQERIEEEGILENLYSTGEQKAWVIAGEEGREKKKK